MDFVYFQTSIVKCQALGYPVVVNKYLVLPFILLVIVLIAGLGYFIFQNQKLIKSLSNTSPQKTASSQLQTSPQVTPLSSPSPQLTLAATQNAIRTNISSKNYEGLISYMAEPKVNFSLMSSECCEPMTPQEAADQMSYIDDGVPFDFNQNADVVKTLKDKNPQLAGTFIGISTVAEHSAAFTIGPDNKITGIQLSVSWKLYTY